MTLCKCGCGEMARREFKKGHHRAHPNRWSRFVAIDIRGVVAAADFAYGKGWRTWGDLSCAAGAVRLCEALRTAEAALESQRAVPDLWHTPRPGPLYWDYRCTVCGEDVADHPYWWARLKRRVAG